MQRWDELAVLMETSATRHRHFIQRTEPLFAPQTSARSTTSTASRASNSRCNRSLWTSTAGLGAKYGFGPSSHIDFLLWDRGSNTISRSSSPYICRIFPARKHRKHNLSGGTSCSFWRMHVNCVLRFLSLIHSLSPPMSLISPGISRMHQRDNHFH